MSIKFLRDEATWQAVARNDNVVTGLLREAVLELATAVDKLTREQQAEPRPIPWLEG